MHKIEKKKQR